MRRGAITLVTTPVSTSPPQFLVIGEILKPWGYRGDVKVKLLTDFPEHILNLKTVYLGAEARAVPLERARLHSGVALIKFGGYDSPEAAAKLCGQTVQVAREDAAPLRAGQYYHYQIIGLEVVTTAGATLGKVTEILETGANDVYVVTRADGSQVLLPAIRDVIESIALARSQMVVRLLPGLI